MFRCGVSTGGSVPGSAGAESLTAPPPAGPAASGPGSSASPLCQRERSHSPRCRQQALLRPGRAPLSARRLSGTGVTHRAATCRPCCVRAGLLCQPAVSAGAESLTALPPAGPAASGPGSSASPLSQRERSHSPRCRQQALLRPGRAPLSARCLSGSGVTHRVATSRPCCVRAGLLCQPAVSVGAESLTALPPAGPAASGPGSSVSPLSQRERSHSPRRRQQALLRPARAPLSARHPGVAREWGWGQ
ncbi:apomucin-like [Brienomyrus brachyistius]|uniref:apomucin-like n=1 Tax=Brienomyrus brachyistius TaxID=42636 RepID=UPI0020B1BA1A|nr:apomucin-like [Brienomyrus brachyistius]